MHFQHRFLQGMGSANARTGSKPITGCYQPVLQYAIVSDTAACAIISDAVACDTAAWVIYSFAIMVNTFSLFNCI